MKKTPTTRSRKVQEMASEYRFDYKKAKPNRFAARMKNEPLIVMIEPDVAKSLFFYLGLPYHINRPDVNVRAESGSPLKRA